MSPNPFKLLSRGPLLLAACLSLGCGAVTRYQILTFFFDGVPPPADGGKSPGHGGGIEGPGMSQHQALPPSFSLHKPFAEKTCDKCHAGLRREKRPTRSGISALPETPRLVAPLDKLCLRCHKQPTAKYVHGPVALGRCETCHFPHRSPYPHLLRKSKSRDLCAICHSPDLFVSAALHEKKGWASKECTSCHDPHESNKPYLIRASGEKKKKKSPKENLKLAIPPASRPTRDGTKKGSKRPGKR